MQTFLDYETGVTKAENLGLSGPAVTLKKRANWIPFMKVRGPMVTPLSVGQQCHTVILWPGGLAAAGLLVPVSCMLTDLNQVSARTKTKFLPVLRGDQASPLPCVQAGHAGPPCLEVPLRWAQSPFSL